MSNDRCFPLLLGHVDEFLCWMYIDSQTVIVIRTSSCNKQTADGILKREDKYLPHLHWLLRLDTGDPDIRDECQRLHHDQEVRWQEQLWSEVYTTSGEGDRRSNSRSSSQGALYGHLGAMFLSLCITVSVFQVVDILLTFVQGVHFYRKTLTACIRTTLGKTTLHLHFINKFWPGRIHC